MAAELIFFLILKSVKLESLGYKAEMQGEYVRQPNERSLSEEGRD